MSVSERDHQLELMNAVLTTRTHRETEGKRKSYLKKRDKKFSDKKEVTSDDPTDFRPII